MNVEKKRIEGNVYTYIYGRREDVQERTQRRSRKREIKGEKCE